jgi:ABC-type multidrug transport system ATPase subunit
VDSSAPQQAPPTPDSGIVCVNAVIAGYGDSFSKREASMIELRRLTKQFGKFTAVNDVSFKAAPGEILALVGPNGSGKSTIMKCIAGLIAPTQGEILVNGKPVAGQKRDWLSYLPQKVNFSENLTGREVIGFYARLRKLAPDFRQRALGISNLNGFGSRPVSQYSAGMLQRLGIAVALMPEAQVLVLDEPTASLDPDAVQRCGEYLSASRSRGQAIIVSSHVLAEVEALADRVGILVHGRLVACEPIRHFREWIAQHATLRITLADPLSDYRNVALRSGAVASEMSGPDLLVTAPADERWRILRALEAAGAQIRRFSTEEPSLESLYLRYVRENSVGNPTGAANGGM